MRVLYQRRFLKDLAEIPPTHRPQIERFAFEDLPRARSLSEIGKVEKLKGYPSFYKVRFGDYRVGLKVTGDEVVLERVLHRREIYRKFP